MVLQNKNITFIGPGVMAEAMIAGIINKKLAAPETLIASGPNAPDQTRLKEKYHIQIFSDNVKAVQDADVVVLSVKPQTLPIVLDELEGKLKSTALVVSIIAGARIKTISKGLNHTAVVRSMPNTPATVGRGITVWTAAEAVNDDQKLMAQTILGAFGEEIFLDNEKYLDMATALSGTGPAYVFLFMEAMMDAGVHLGFPRRIAEQLVVETIYGSLDYYQNSSDVRLMHPARMRNQVTSPGGTTAEAMYYLEKAGFRTAISRAIWAAYERSVALGQESKPSSEKD